MPSRRQSERDVREWDAQTHAAAFEDEPEENDSNQRLAICDVVQLFGESANPAADLDRDRPRL